MKVRVNSDEYDCSHIDSIICPYCMGEMSDPWEIEQGDGISVECEDCGREFEVTTYIEVTYTSYPKAQINMWEKGDIFEDGLSEENEEWANENGVLPCEAVREDENALAITNDLLDYKS